MSKEITTAPEAQAQEMALPSSPGELMFSPGMFERVERMADILAKSKAMVPRFLRNNPSDCMSIVMKAAQWRMDPYAVAGKAYQAVDGGPIGYEAQLINAVIINNAPIEGRPKYDFFGDWSKIQGNIATKTSQKGKKYQAANWKDADEEGVGVTISVTLSDTGEELSMPVLLKQCYPRNSTNWANDPQQQICYRAIQILSRRHFPDVTLGLYTKDEVAAIPERDMGTAEVVTDVEDLLKGNDTGVTIDREPEPKQTEAPTDKKPAMASSEQVAATLDAFAAIGIIKKQVDGYLGGDANAMTWDQYVDLRQVYGKVTEKGLPMNDFFEMPKSTVTPNQIEQMLNSADSGESLSDIEVLINTLSDAEAKDRLNGMLAVRRMELESN